MPEVGIIRQGISRYQPQPTTTNLKCHNHQPFLSIIPSKSNGFCSFRFVTAGPYEKSGIFADFVRFGVGPSPKSGIFRVFVRFGVGPYEKSGIFADFVRFGAGPYGKSGIFADFVRFGAGPYGKSDNFCRFCPIGRRAVREIGHLSDWAAGECVCQNGCAANDKTKLQQANTKAISLCAKWTGGVRQSDTPFILSRTRNRLLKILAYFGPAQKLQ